MLEEPPRALHHLERADPVRSMSMEDSRCRCRRLHGLFEFARRADAVTMVGLSRGVRSLLFAVLVGTLGACAQGSSAGFSDGDRGKVVLSSSYGGVTFWLYRNHDDAQGHVCYGLATGPNPPTKRIDSGGFCLDETFSAFEADPITASSDQGLQMAVGGAISPQVARVSVIVDGGTRYEAKIRHGFYLAVMPYGDFVASAFDEHGNAIAEADRPRPPTSIPSPRLRPPPGSPPP
jgi:hypothetical protein